MTQQPTIDKRLDEGVEQRIIDAAKVEFAASGFKAASVRSIAARAGVTAAMINYYFRSKQNLYDKIVAQAQRRLYELIEAELTSGDAATLPVRLTGAYFDYLSEEYEFQRLLLREVLDKGENIPAFIDKYVTPLRDVFTGLFGGGEDSVQIAMTIFGATAGYFIYEPVMSMVTDTDRFSPENLRARRRHVLELAALLSNSRYPAGDEVAGRD